MKTTVTITRTVKYPVAYKCEKCGEVNAILHPFAISSSYVAKGWRIFDDWRATRAIKSLDTMQDGLFENINRKTRERDFEKVEYACVCSKCNSVPQWSFFKKRWLENLLGIVLLVAFFISVFFLAISMSNGNQSAINKFLILLGVVATTYLVRFFIYNSKRKQILKMSEEYMPVVCKDKESLLEVVKNLEEKFVR